MSLLTCFFCYILDQNIIQEELSSRGRPKDSQLDVFMTHEDGTAEDDSGHRKLNNSVHELSSDPDTEKAKSNNDLSVSSGLIESNGLKHLSESGKLYSEDKTSFTVHIISDSEDSIAGNRPQNIEESSKSEGDTVSSSDSGPENSDANINTKSRYTWCIQLNHFYGFNTFF